jgi:nitrite reductase/ring-hydroxylating ferredoxin subunit
MSESKLEFDTGLRADQLDRQRPCFVETPWGAMALFVVGADVVCTQAFCPHLEGPLFQGSVADGCVTCPWHYWRFDLRTGRRVGVFGIPFGSERLTRCPVTRGESGTLVLQPPVSD